MPEMSAKSDALNSPKSLNNAQYDAWALRSALIARSLATTSLPGDTVFTSRGGPENLAFTQLGSFGVTYGAMGLVKNSKKAWSILARAGFKVPDSKTMSAEDDRASLRFAQQFGYPVVVSSQSGVSRRVASEPEELVHALTEVGKRVKGQVLVSTTLAGERVRILVRGSQVVAGTLGDKSESLSLDELDPSILKLAVDAVGEIPGLDLGGVTIVTPRLASVKARTEAIVERVTHYPHLRDFSGGTRNEAMRISNTLVESAAQGLGVHLGAPRQRVKAQFDFSGIPFPQTFVSALRQVVATFTDMVTVSAPQLRTDGVRLQLDAAPDDAALLITRAIIGFDSENVSHMVICEPEV